MVRYLGAIMFVAAVTVFFTYVRDYRTGFDSLQSRLVYDGAVIDMDIKN